MRKLVIIILIIIVVIFVSQVAFLVYTTGRRQDILQTGRVVFLKAAPSYPKGQSRGDYVRLRYEISAVSDDLFRDGLADLCIEDSHNLQNLLQYAMIYKSRKMKGKTVYGLLNVGEYNIAELISLTDKKPSDGFFIRGRIAFPRFGGLNVRYGIETYSVEQEKEKEIEKAMSQSMRIPLEMEVVIGKDGTAVLKGYRWSPLGIDIVRDVNELSVEEDVGASKKLKGVTVKLFNNSDKPIGIIDLPDGQSFTLEPDESFAMFTEEEQDYKWVGAGKERKKVEDSDVHILEPGKTYEFYIDFYLPRWFVAGRDKQPMSISEAMACFRLVYRPPSKDECNDLQKADLVWHGSLAGTSFDAGSWRKSFRTPITLKKNIE